MPSGIFPVSEVRPVSSQTRPSVGLRILTRLKRPGLDVDLSRGADPAASADLSLRAVQLRSPAERTRLANALEEALGDARGRNLGAFTGRRRQQHAVIRQYADDLLALTRRLREDRPVDVRGAAMMARLVDDRTGPLYRNGERGLHDAISAAHFALDAAGETAHPEPLAAAA